MNTPHYPILKCAFTLLAILTLAGCGEDPPEVKSDDLPADDLPIDNPPEEVSLPAPSKTVPPESVLITPAGWKREDLPEKAEKAGLLSIVNEDQTVKVGIHVRPPHSEEMEFRNSSSGNLAGLLNKGLYPTEMSIRKLAGIRSYFFEGAIKLNNFTSWMRNYYVPGKKATYVLFVSRGQGSDWPDLSTMLKIDDEESPLADTPYAEFEGKVKFVFEDFQKNARRRPGFEEPDLSDQRD